MRKRDFGVSHSAVEVLAGLPVGVGHGELVEVGEQWRDHGVGRSRHRAAARVPVGRRVGHASLSLGRVIERLGCVGG